MEKHGFPRQWIRGIEYLAARRATTRVNVFFVGLARSRDNAFAQRVGRGDNHSMDRDIYSLEKKNEGRSPVSFVTSVTRYSSSPLVHSGESARIFLENLSTAIVHSLFLFLLWGRGSFNDLVPLKAMQSFFRQWDSRLSLHFSRQLSTF